jgi:hypothetical protein
MIRTTGAILAMAAALAAATSSRAGEPILVQVPAAFDPNAAVSDAVRRECAVDVLLSNEVFTRVKARFPESALLQVSSGVANEKVLNLTILSVNAAGGGAWSGRKAVTVRADLVQSGRIVATTLKERASGGGAFGGFKGTCAILDRVTAALGADVASWLSKTLLPVGSKSPSAMATESPKEVDSEPASTPAKDD